MPSPRKPTTSSGRKAAPKKKKAPKAKKTWRPLLLGAPPDTSVLKTLAARQHNAPCELDAQGFADLPADVRDLLRQIRSPWKGVMAAMVKRRLVEVVEETFAGTTLAEPIAAWIGRGKQSRAQYFDMIASRLDMPLEARRDLAAAVELAHAGTLLQDDIIDESPERRGLPALWKTHGIKAAMLAGNMLAIAGIDLVRQCQAIDEDQRFWLADELFLMVGETCHGELIQDFHAPDAGPVSRDRIAAEKTGSFFLWAAEAGGLPMLDDLSDEDLDVLRQGGLMLGVLFQRIDDGEDYPAGELKRPPIDFDSLFSPDPDAPEL